MDIKIYPKTLNINNETLLCPCCKNKLFREIKKDKYLKTECTNCRRYDRYTDRPFCIGADRGDFGECSYEYQQIDFVSISCEICLNSRCKKCNKITVCDNTNCNNKLCSECKEKEKFYKKWSSSTSSEKLGFYGIKKLKILAKKKNIKGFSKYNKQELIELLTPIVNDNDFPIQ